MNIIDISQGLREIADNIPEDEKVSLPAIRPGMWREQNDANYEKVELAGLLRFIADMVE